MANNGPTWTTPSGNLTNYARNVAYSSQLSASDDGTLTYSLLSGTLPAGVTLSSSGLVSGTPTVLTNHTFSVRITDDAGNTEDRSFNLNNVGASAPTWVTASGALSQSEGGVAYSTTVSATDDSGAAPSYSISAGSLPSGLSLSAAGVISGTPNGAGGGGWYGGGAEQAQHYAGGGGSGYYNASYVSSFAASNGGGAAKQTNGSAQIIILG